MQRGPVCSPSVVYLPASRAASTGAPRLAEASLRINWHFTDASEAAATAVVAAVQPLCFLYSELVLVRA